MRKGINKSLAAKMVHEVIEIQKISSKAAEYDNDLNRIDAWATSLEEDMCVLFSISPRELDALYDLGKAAFERDLRKITGR
jgi:hypothetical protein